MILKNAEMNADIRDNWIYRSFVKFYYCKETFSNIKFLLYYRYKNKN